MTARDTKKKRKVIRRKVNMVLSGVDLPEQEPTAQYRVHQRSIGSEYFDSLKKAVEHIEEEIKEIFSVTRCIEWSIGDDTEIPYEITGIKIKLRQKKA